MIDLRPTREMREIYDSVVTISDYMTMHKNLSMGDSNRTVRMINSGWPEREGNFRKIGEISIPKDYYENHLLTQDVDPPTDHNLTTEQKFLSGNHVSASMGYDLSVLRSRISKQFGLAECEVALHDQPPGGIHGWHFDSMFFYYNKIWLPADESRADLPFNKELQWVDDGTCPQRLFLALTDWQYGQVFGFGSKIWSGWKAGDVLWFDWQNLPHYTANTGISNRAIVRITGLSSLTDLRYDRFIS